MDGSPSVVLRHIDICACSVFFWYFECIKQTETTPTTKKQEGQQKKRRNQNCLNSKRTRSRYALRNQSHRFGALRASKRKCQTKAIFPRLSFSRALYLHLHRCIRRCGIHFSRAYLHIASIPTGGQIRGARVQVPEWMEPHSPLAFSSTRLHITQQCICLEHSSVPPISGREADGRWPHHPDSSSASHLHFLEFKMFS